MYHPTRGGVRGGRDQFTWDEVKVDKHRENYLGHSVKAPVGRWQKGKDLFWYTRDKNSADSDAAKEEIRRIKEDEEQSMREALGLAPKRANRLQGSRLDKHEFSELVKRGSTAEDLGAGHAEAAQVQGLGFTRAPRTYEESGSATLPAIAEVKPSNMTTAAPAIAPAARENDESDEERSRKKLRREEKKREKKLERREEKHERREKRHSEDRREKRHSEDRRSGKKERREKKRHDSD